jgi:hypothetical protein
MKGSIGASQKNKVNALILLTSLSLINFSKNTNRIATPPADRSCKLF